MSNRNQQPRPPTVRIVSNRDALAAQRPAPLTRRDSGPLGGRPGQFVAPAPAAPPRQDSAPLVPVGPMTGHEHGNMDRMLASVQRHARNDDAEKEARAFLLETWPLTLWVALGLTVIAVVLGRAPLLSWSLLIWFFGASLAVLVARYVWHDLTSAGGLQLIVIWSHIRMLNRDQKERHEYYRRLFEHQTRDDHR